MDFILALDQGTTSSRAMVFDHAGAVRAMAQREFAQIFPQPGRVEHDPMEIWETQLAVARETLVNAGAFDQLVPRREQAFAAIDAIIGTAQRTNSNQNDGIDNLLRLITRNR